MHIRPYTTDDTPALIEIHNSLNIAWPEPPGNAEAWAEADRSRDPALAFQRWAAEDHGRVVGFASYGQFSGEACARFFQVKVEVHAGYQRRGIGSALYDAVTAGMEPYRPSMLRADAFTNLPQGFAFLRKRGYFEAFRETPVHLNLASFESAPYAGLEPRLAEQGITIRTLSELETDPERDRKLYDLYWAVNEDVPHEAAFPSTPPCFEDFQRWFLNPAATLPDAYFIALHGKRYIGLRELFTYPGSRAMLGSLLGVLREYRGRGVGLALHLRGIRYASAHGYEQVKTCTAVQNAPMQALFNRLGYTRDPEWQQCQKDL